MRKQLAILRKLGWKVHCRAYNGWIVFAPNSERKWYLQAHKEMCPGLIAFTYMANGTDTIRVTGSAVHLNCVASALLKPEIW